MVIDEPKTPFHYPNSDDASAEDIDEMELFDSDDAKTYNLPTI
jgi:hypothetical protein